MKKFLWMIILPLLSESSVWAQPVYKTLPDPTCRLVTLGSRVVVQDAQGFFLGYYQPAPPTAPPYTPMPKATTSRLNADTYLIDRAGRRVPITGSLPQFLRDAYVCDPNGRRNPYAEAGYGPDDAHY